LIDQIWDGVYNDFKEVPVAGDGFSGEKWEKNSHTKLLELLDQADSDSAIPPVVSYYSSLLPMLAGLLSGQDRKVKILDLGGSLGFTYVPVINGVVRDQQIDYHVIDLERICELGSRIFKDDHRIHFQSSLPDDIPDLDIVHTNSSMQYIEDWRGMLAKLARYSPRYFLFDNLWAGDIPTYATAQNYYGSTIPCWFFNIEDVFDTMSTVGFELLFKATYVAPVFGQQQEFPQENFAEEYRLGYPCSLLFCRKE
jgi:putative methyltransferase (TIGR04325 family)